jgi:hypothetical protein
MMKTLSEQLADLSDRSKRIEDLLTETREKNLEGLAARRDALKTSLSEGESRLGDAADALADKVKAPWKHARTAVEKAFATAREEADERRSHHGVAKAERRAEHAEESAVGAATLAAVVLDETENAVAEAVRARAEAVELAASADAAADDTEAADAADAAGATKA